MQFDVEGAYFGLEISDGVFFLFDVDSEHAYFFGHAFDFFRVLFILFFQFSEQMVSLFL